MAISDAEFSAWTRDPQARRRLLLELDWHPRRFSVEVLTLPEPPAIDNTATLTVVLHLDVVTVADTSGFAGSFVWRAAFGASRWLEIGMDGSGNPVVVIDDGPNQVTQTFTGDPISNGETTRLVLLLDRGADEIRVYRDGAALTGVADISSVGAINPDSCVLSSGSGVSGEWHHRELQHHTRLLSPAEIAALEGGGFPPWDALSDWYRMREGYGRDLIAGAKVSNFGESTRFVVNEGSAGGLAHAGQWADTADGGPDTLYLADGSYQSGPGDTPANQRYEPLLSDPGSFTQLLPDDLIGLAQESYGALSLTGPLARLRVLADGDYEGRAWVMRIGAPDWSRADFRRLAHGSSGGAAFDGRRLTIHLGTDRRMLDALVQGADYTDSSGSGGTLPICVGQVAQVAPVFLSSTLHQYAVHDGQIEAVTPSVAAVGVTHTDDLANGRFTLDAAPGGGELRASVTGHDPGGGAPLGHGEIMRYLIETFSDLVTADLDTASFADAYLNEEPCGDYIAAPEPLRDVLDRFARSTAGFLALNRAGQVMLRQVDPRTHGTPDLVLERAHLLAPLRRLGERPVVERVNTGYLRRHAPLTQYAGSVGENPGERLKQPWDRITYQQHGDDLGVDAVDGAYPITRDVEHNTLNRNVFHSVETSQISTWRVAVLLMQYLDRRRNLWEVDTWVVPTADLGDLVQVTDRSREDGAPPPGADPGECLAPQGRRFRLVGVTLRPPHDYTLLLWG